MQSVVFGNMIIGGQEVSMIELFSKKYICEKPCDKGQILTFYNLIGNVTYPMWPWFILLSKVRKMDYQNTKHIEILYDLIKGCWWKELLEC
jgi:hypothetical protein